MRRLMLELPDKQRVVDMLETVRNWPEIRKIIFSKIPNRADLVAHTHGSVRLLFAIEGNYHFQYYDDGLKEAVIAEGDYLYVDRKSVLINVMDTECVLLTVIFLDKCIRYLISERTFDCYSNFWYHTANPVCNAGRHLLQSISEINLNQLDLPVRRALLKSLVEFALYEIIHDKDVEVGKAHSTYQIIKENMQVNLHKPITRKSIAEQVGITPSHLSKLFQRFDQHNFNSALQRLRINRAVQLLEEYDANINEIAGLCGFKDTTHFIKIFKKFHRITPAKYRDNHEK